MLSLLFLLIGLPTMALVRRAQRRRTRALRDAVFARDLAEIQRLGRKDKWVNARDEGGHSALHHAYYAGEEAIVEELLSLGANEHLHSLDGITARQMTLVRHGGAF
jgi:ankyrin repeat protein